ncbi:MAG: DUF2723 domain-containing protein [Pseudomonadota bacterium]
MRFPKALPEHSQGKNRDIFTSLGILFFFFLFFQYYLWKVFPDIYWVDSGEFAFHSIFLGIPHPTGYPTYIQLLKLFSLFPFGSPYFLINFTSSIFGFVSLIILYKIIFQLTQKKFPSLFAVFIFGLSPSFMSKLDVAEVYTLQILILLSVVYLFLSWMVTKDKRKVIMISFLLGLGFTNHMTTVLLIPAILIIFSIINRNARDTLKTIALSVPFFLLGCLPYLFIYLRNDLPGPFNFAKQFNVDFKTIQGWYWLLTGELFRYEMQPTSLLAYLNQVGFFGYLLFKDFYYLPVLIGLLGLTGQMRVDRKRFIVLFCLFLSLTGFFLYYQIPDISDYFTMSFALFSIWIGIGVHRILEYAQSSNFIRNQTIFLALGVFCLIPVYANLTEEKSKTNEFSLEYSHKIFALLPNNSLLFTTYTGGNSLLLMQRLSSIRPDITIFDYGVFSLKERADLAKHFDPRGKLFPNIIHSNFRNKFFPYIIREINKRPVFFSRDEAFLNNLFFRRKIEEGLYEITRKSLPKSISELPQTATSISLAFDRKFSLSGYEIFPSSIMEGELFTMDLYWKAALPLTQEVIGLLYFIKEGSKTFSFSNTFFQEFTLGSDLFPPTQWKPGQIVRDRFQFSVRPNIRKGNYQIKLALFEKIYFQNIPFDKLKLNLVPIGEVFINENPKLMHYWDRHKNEK